MPRKNKREEREGSRHVHDDFSHLAGKPARQKVEAVPDYSKRKRNNDTSH